MQLKGNHVFVRLTEIFQLEVILSTLSVALDLDAWILIEGLTSRHSEVQAPSA